MSICVFFMCAWIAAYSNNDIFFMENKRDKKIKKKLKVKKLKEVRNKKKKQNNALKRKVDAAKRAIIAHMHAELHAYLCSQKFGCSLVHT